MKLHLLEGREMPLQANFLIGFPSVANVGQLAIDSILSTLGAGAERLGYIESEYLLPISGYDRAYPTAPVSLCLPVEVYKVIRQNDEDSSTPTVIIQQRCPVIAGKHKEYNLELLELLSSLKYNLALILTGASSLDNEEDFGGYPAAMDMNNKLFSVCTESGSAHLQSQQRLVSLNAFVRSQTVSQPLLAPSPYNTTTSSLLVTSSNTPPPPPTTTTPSATALLSSQLPHGMQLAKGLLEAAVKSSNSPSDGHAVVVVGKICHEGDNLLDGLEMATHVMNAMFPEKEIGGKQFSVASMGMPESWNVRLFQRSAAPLHTSTPDMFY
jgi:hypothetical protein